ncbi:LEAF RUST 10 DISEASE-RESISTANCE LOCUS RECEPTOR-LIKE PROTEIN KINASE-like 1.1 isoform X3 [Quercus robur]|uniref:LEAF RUST 10 DISEASE-RESISTANCE LOCUS RECEPTOR-LIKE PROTEIN KINASE-like 1.1 isoform X3 n=1 Tax=Quercus robur TaxID=38942 RepID=UPI002161DA2F|nr:LEAF RUST 10 DISEASE-RESISTANCE LOCUS RECEPTOR-LIKE PROTEIN KINASE-like 1.1 isoform X3 [Quercus robur]
MASVSLFVLIFVLSHLVLLHSAEEGGKPENPYCLPFQCGKLGNISFPFTETPQPFPSCEMQVECDETHPMINFPLGDWRITRRYEVININHTNTAQHIRVKDHSLLEYLKTNKCESLDNFTIPHSPFISFKLTTPHWSLFKCYRPLQSTSDRNFKKMTCRDHYNFYYSPSNEASQSSPPGCLPILLPVDETSHEDELNLIAEFDLELQGSDYCSSCNGKEGEENKNNNKVVILLENKNNNKVVILLENKNNNKVVIPLAIGCAVSFMSTLFFIIWHLYKKKYPSSNLLARNTYSDPSSRSEVEGWSVYYGVPVFSYNELEKATNNFHVEKELGNGGFGTVYHGKLHDGREVAVKRLYRPNYRRVEQFINEVEILTRLRHKNLVSLYGCTSRHSRELLLVYEYIPNGTVADHIHGHQATPGSLTWPTRMSIAIETASALAYLHASDIIHRDVKTNNILLDDNFCVKVADFGLSRLFPNDVSHVSTAPQGTPGYVDPEYGQCYQLTSKSDVYSFGVVLMELISSLPAIDIFRQKHEINLAKLAVNKIEKCAFHELIDPHLGFESDDGVRTMTILVAKLAFQCLQQDKEMRPSMDEVLEALKKIPSGKDAHEDQEMAYDDAGILNVQQPSSPDRDEVRVLRNKRLPLLPEDVTNFWTSRSTTPSAKSNF